MILLSLLICVLTPYQVPWVYNSEINSLGWRTRGAAAATATNWMGGFIVTQFTKIGVDTLKWRFYLRKQYLYDTEDMRWLLNKQSLRSFAGPTSQSCSVFTPKHLAEHSRIWTKSLSTAQRCLYLVTNCLRRESVHKHSLMPRQEEWKMAQLLRLEKSLLTARTSNYLVISRTLFKGYDTTVGSMWRMAMGCLISQIKFWYSVVFDVIEDIFRSTLRWKHPIGLFLEKLSQYMVWLEL